MIPNIICAAKCPEGFENRCGKAVTALEQVGRYGCFAFVALNIPLFCRGFASDGVRRLYLAVNAALLLAYCLVWVFCFRGKGLFRALALSVLPSAIFLFSGVVCRNLPLLVFAPCHILISCRNAR